MGIVVPVKISVIPMGNSFRITTEIEDLDMQREFNRRDAATYDALLKEQFDSAFNTGKRRNDRKDVAVGQRVQADDYKTEPDYAHSGIHLGMKSGDEIQWRSDQLINFIIDVGPDPELFRVKDKALDDDDKLPMKALHDKKHSPFVDTGVNRIVCVNGIKVQSGRLQQEESVKLQQYFKFSVTIMGTNITLDPHFEGHDE